MRRGILAAAWTLSAVAPVTAQEPLSWGEMQTELAARSFPAPAVTLAYGDGPHRFGELRLPQGEGPFPVAVVVHGGCWLSMAGVDYMVPLAEALVREGWATWSLEFRRIDQPGGAWPGILEDVAAGADFLREVAAEHPLDLERVVAVGHSSGGHLALWLAARHRLPGDAPDGPRLRGEAPLPLAGVVGLAPIAHLRDFRQYPRCGATIVEDLLGGRLDPDRLRLSDPASLVPLGVPQLLLLGDLDAIVPPAHGDAYGAAARAAGDTPEMVTVPGAGHFELVAPWTAGWRGVQARLVAFLAGVGSGDR